MDKKIEELPVGEFVTAKEAAEMLGITIATLGMRLKRGSTGLPVHIQINHLALYHRPSVEALISGGQDGE